MSIHSSAPGKGARMPKTANINIRIDPETKKEAEEVFSSFGITLSDAITIFLRKSIMNGGLPFEMKGKSPSAAKRF